MPLTTATPRRPRTSSLLRREAQHLAALSKRFAEASRDIEAWMPPAMACAAFAQRLLECRSAPRCAAALRLAQATSPCDQIFDELSSRADDDWNVAARSIAEEFADFEFDEFSAAEQVTQFVEHFLAAYDDAARRRHGVYYTPAIIANYLVARADEALAEHFPPSRGLIDAGHIFDPAVGTGVFPLAVIDRIYETLVVHWRANGHNESTFAELWDAYVRTSLLHRLRGCELMPAAQVVAQLLIGERLAAYGFRPSAGDRLCIEVADALAPLAPLRGEGLGVRGCASIDLSILDDVPTLFHTERELERPVVILGNPPYRGVSASEHAWIDALLRGHSRDGRNVASYFHVDGEPLREKKHWLHDDYVKFFRLAQWQVEQAGAGVVAFVTNHGYLDNPTFRGMRCGLLKTFSRIDVVDLHGNVKHGAAERDESVFTTQQGMALSLHIAPPQCNAQRVVRRADLRGSRAEKLAQLASTSSETIAFELIQPQAPQYCFHHEAAPHAHEYEQFWPIDELMPVSTTAIVTARDALVIAFTREELIERLQRFRDLSISDEQIRRELFSRSRTGRYPPGDTRGWKLRPARERLAADEHWQENIRTCLYRPFDRRFIYWSPAMIDWPRPEVMRHMEAGDNLAIVCRRQQVRGAPCNFFWIADDLVIDGYIRSDNRGSESIFPLWLAPPTDCDSNFTSAFMSAVPSQLGDAEPLRLFQFIYAIFHSATYRERYAEPLTNQFPRVPLPPSRAVFDELASLGETLLDLHLLRDPSLATSSVQLVGDKNSAIAAGYPKFLGDAVAIAPGEQLESISAAVWHFHIGAHQPLRKWLKDRRGRKLLPVDVEHYAHMVSRIERTLALVPRIDETIQTHGGWARFDTQARRASKGSGS